MKSWVSKHMVQVRLKNLTDSQIVLLYKHDEKAMSKFVIETAIRENYAAHNDDLVVFQHTGKTRMKHLYRRDQKQPKG